MRTGGTELVKSFFILRDRPPVLSTAANLKVRDAFRRTYTLKTGLDLIVQSDASLANDPSYQRLREYARRRGG